MSLNFYAKLQQLLQQDAIVLATVVNCKGSVPREVGAKMIICADGRIVQTIGGGAGEAKVIQHALSTLKTGEKQLIDIDLTGNLTHPSQRETQGICGGMMQVWLERWAGGSIALVQKILDRLRSGQPATLVTPLHPEQLPYLSHEGAISNQENAFIETIQPPPTLLIVGAGHVGVQLAKVAHLIEFQIAVQDDRPEWANSQLYPNASLIFAEPITTALDHLSTHTQLYAALVTRSYIYDLEALKALLARTIPCTYIGMIGSTRRVQQVFQAIEPAKISREKCSRIHAPIGLDIGALTPEEIAVSISAELILTRRGGTGLPRCVDFLRTLC